MGLNDKLGIRRGRGILLHLHHAGVVNTGFDVVKLHGADIQPVRARQSTGRNSPCHCGSGKKFKRCHGR